jgi:hypothetical protein
MRGAKVALIAGLALLAVGIGVVAAQHPAALARANGAMPDVNLTTITSPARLCQAHELVPAGTTAVVAWLGAFTGPRVLAEIVEDGRVVARGEHGPAWSGRSVTIALRPISRPRADVTVCFKLAPKYEAVVPRGSASGHPATSEDGRSLPGQMTIEYLRPARGTWFSEGSGAVRRLGLGRIPSGLWAPMLVILLAIAMVGLVASLVAGRLR